MALCPFGPFGLCGPAAAASGQALPAGDYTIPGHVRTVETLEPERVLRDATLILDGSAGGKGLG
ncbi:hypothetical protein [Kiritimatiella glycovorans]|uniref:Uncharacterized protein n=1 Tax=Kiritimatiella glycovorans TaxID=1307763 RepID=A0A0G3EMT3_9BACT|nr:hypothetical protein [Kiritimatiella glycovorans]AKJ65419.1 hypothetical protein L21SP4_02192 [Kiritimatiella glycovorans]